MRRLVALVALVLAVGVAGSAEAVQISGSFGIGGNFTWVDENGFPVPLSSGLAVALDFNNDGIPNTGSFIVLNDSGDFDAFMTAFDENVLATTGTITDFRHTGSGGIYPNAPLVLLSVAGFTFLLQDIEEVTTSNTPSISIKGTGLFSGNGFDPTPGTFNFSGQCASDAGVSCTAFTFSASNVATPSVPEPGSLLLLGLGFSAVSATAWRRGRK